MSSNKLFLYDHPVSSYAQKVRMALRHKGIPFEKQTPPNLGSGASNPDFSSANIRKEVPALIDGDFAIFDSTAILMYLEENFPTTPKLLPDSPQARASARMIEDVCDTHYEAINWAIGEITWFERATGPEAERLLAAAVEQTKQIQIWLEGKLGDKPYFSGEKIGYADFAVAPIVNRSVHYGTAYGPAEGCALQLWHARVSENVHVMETFAEMVEGSKAMSSLGPNLWTGGRRREYRDHRLEFLIKNGGIGIVLKGLEDDNIRFSWPHPK
ncbi:uncharacterized protein RCC_04254 [Ramularia collo-cygni]|uniref:Glutathione S-transferase n=1 Tax=Ramularia collo-cygni TaxID=112498 RepID=A0A2D3VA54_9PEZI|nr:uncharacterized protein RCC_04254 [Ramularia collo-cygni]CZT18409.1 uncharacterized protein RCC_04254 [Ramularia collo-cygni]